MTMNSSAAANTQRPVMGLFLCTVALIAGIAISNTGLMIASVMLGSFAILGIAQNHLFNTHDSVDTSES